MLNTLDLINIHERVAGRLEEHHQPGLMQSLH